MKFYYVDGSFVCTLIHAKKLARDAAEDAAEDVPVDLVEVSTDKENMLRLVNDRGGFMQTIKCAHTAKAKRTKKGCNIS